MVLSHTLLLSPYIHGHCRDLLYSKSQHEQQQQQHHITQRKVTQQVLLCPTALRYSFVSHRNEMVKLLAGPIPGILLRETQP